MRIWFLLGLLQLLMGAVALATAVALRRRGESAGRAALYGCAALAVGAVLLQIRG